MTRSRNLVGVVVLLAAGETLAQPPGRTPTNSVNVFYAATEAHIQAELKATEEQKKQLDTAAQAFKQAVRIADAAPDEFRAALEAANASLKTSLNAEQILRLRQIVTQRAVAQNGLVAYLGATPGKSLLAPTPEQEKRFEAITAETAAALKKAVLAYEPFEKFKERFASIRQEHEKKLIDTLTPAQQAKWKQATGIAFQDTPIRQPNPPAGGFGLDMRNPETMFPRYAENQGNKDFLEIDKVQSRMDPEMPAKMKAYAAKKGITNGKLTKEQFADFWVKEFVPAIEARQGTGGFGFPGITPIRRTLPTVSYLLEPDIQKDLALVADQVTRVQEAREKYDVALKDTTGTPAERAARRLAAVKEAEDSAMAVLKEPQKARLEQLRAQEIAQPMTSISTALRDTKTTEALKLTPEDLNRITNAEADLRRVASFLQSETPILLGSTPARPNPAVEELTTAYRQKSKASLEKLLTPEQKTRWDALLGKPYQGKFPPSP